MKFLSTLDLVDIQRRSEGPCWDDLGPARILVYVVIVATATLGAWVMF